MIRELVFRTQAQDEYRDAFLWYEDQQEGLGSKFEREMESIFEAIQKAPARYPLVEKDVREAPVRRFPYCVYYRVRLNYVIILAIFHTSRDPNSWQARI